MSRSPKKFIPSPVLLLSFLSRKCSKIKSLVNTTNPNYKTQTFVFSIPSPQDNMCVVNTSLLFFLFARREGQLAQLLQRLRARGQGNPRVLRNFRSLLEYWKHYYLRQRGRDSRSIEYSTNVPFREW